MDFGGYTISEKIAERSKARNMHHVRESAAAKAIVGLKQHELDSFAPRTLSNSQYGTGALSSNMPTFPLMNLPLELRLSVYYFHFTQSMEPHWVFTEKDHQCKGHRDCPIRTHNRNVPVRLLWTVSKTLYREAMPIYFQSKTFKFFSRQSLGHFLKCIGAYHRQHIKSLDLGPISGLLESGTGKKAIEIFATLRDCPNLE